MELQGRMGFVPVDGGPNQIGNVEDGPVLPDNAKAETSAFFGAELRTSPSTGQEGQSDRDRSGPIQSLESVTATQLLRMQDTMSLGLQDVG